MIKTNDHLGNGVVIMFDGPDGIGKTTQIELARQQLEVDGYTVHVTRAHGGTPIGEELRKVSFMHLERPPETDLYISLAMHQALAQNLRAKREQGVVTLIDRSPLSIIAYQVYGDGLDGKLALDRAKESLRVLQPELLILYRTSSEIFKSRLKNRQGLSKAKIDFFESKPPEYFENVQKGYDACSEEFDVQLVDASQDIPTVHEATMKLIRNILSH